MTDDDSISTVRKEVFRQKRWPSLSDRFLPINLWYYLTELDTMGLKNPHYDSSACERFTVFSDIPCQLTNGLRTSSNLRSAYLFSHEARHPRVIPSMQAPPSALKPADGTRTQSSSGLPIGILLLLFTIHRPSPIAHHPSPITSFLVELQV
jgi:hypothetical protein